ncbi:unnamed protein product [Anisakis simplex]|uniref:Uncharacterized protein n=1 Tax=Anisakis simplex TaxID=6269 RepID=A0A0M3JIT3_ANISI|nr:unnamed protein product [Anisakis simplex]
MIECTNLGFGIVNFKIRVFEVDLNSTDRFNGLSNVVCWVDEGDVIIEEVERGTGVGEVDEALELGDDGAKVCLEFEVEVEA